MSNPIEREFILDDLALTGKEWGMPGGLPVLALHGWLDNCGSFDRLAPLLEDVHLLTLDSAGHGLSSHRAASSPYLIWQDVGELFAVADQMGWQSFALLGHSRGAIISTLAAGTFPERITHLALIDGFLPGTTSPAEAPQQLAKSIVETTRAQRGFAVYASEDMAIAARQHGMISTSSEAASLLLPRGLKTVDGGYTWTSDPRLKIASGVRLTEDHCDAFVDRITAPIKLIIADDGIPMLRERHMQSIERYPRVNAAHLPGRHHLHMEDQAEQVADVINDFFQTHR